MSQNLVAMSSVQVQSYCLRRKNHYSDMAEHFERMFKEESMVDVTLSCGDGCVKAHKMVLSACSTYFKNIFSKFTNPYQYPVVIIKDMPFEDLRAIIEFIYRGEVVVPQSQLASILRSAEALRVKGLSDAKRRMDDEEENSNRKRKKRKKKAKSDMEAEKKTDNSNNCGAIGGGPNAPNSENNGHSNEVVNPEEERDLTEEGTDYSEEDDSNQSVTNITPVNHQVNTGRTFTEANSNTEAEIEPSRLLEQSMITGEDRESQSVPRFAAPMNMPVTTIDPVINQEIKPLIFGETSGLIPQISLSSSTIPSTDASLASSSHNHLPPIPGAVPITSFDAGMLSIPGPSNISSVVPRTIHHAQEHYTGPTHPAHPPQMPQNLQSAQLIPLQMHPSLGCHSLSSPLSVDSLTGKRHYQCPDCFKTFTEKGNMKRHTQIHSQHRDRFVCDICSKCFAWKDNFHRHRRLAHSDAINCK